ncbi:MAG: hypothetical protein HQM11_21105 [SAR324 cluster bacterium]|nr:hypothetical protein [SAR324 cluster bacterium]
MNAYGEELYKGKELFEPLQGEEKYRTLGFRELALIYGSCEDSYRKTAALINRVRYQLQEGTPERTLRDNTQKEGRQIQAYLKEKTDTILAQSGFSAPGLPLAEQAMERIIPVREVAPELLMELIEDCAVEDSLKSEILKNPVPYEDPEQAVHISLDDVGAKKQKEVRLKEPLESSPVVKKREYVQNTVVHVHKKKTRYLLNGDSLFNVLRMLLAFLLNNQLGGCPWVFFVDGHSLYSSLRIFFSWRSQLTVILDWFHLEKKCKELLSMACKGSLIRNSILDKLLPLLWHGLVEQAVESLRLLPESQIKNQEELLHLIRYLEKNRPMIPAYCAVCCRQIWFERTDRGVDHNNQLCAV